MWTKSDSSHVVAHARMSARTSPACGRPAEPRHSPACPSLHAPARSAWVGRAATPLGSQRGPPPDHRVTGQRVDRTPAVSTLLGPRPPCDGPCTTVLGPDRTPPCDSDEAGPPGYPLRVTEGTSSVCCSAPVRVELPCSSPRWSLVKGPVLLVRMTSSEGVPKAHGLPQGEVGDSLATPLGSPGSPPSLLSAFHWSGTCALPVVRPGKGPPLLDVRGFVSEYVPCAQGLPQIEVGDRLATPLGSPGGPHHLLSAFQPSSFIEARVVWPGIDRPLASGRVILCRTLDLPRTWDGDGLATSLGSPGDALLLMSACQPSYLTVVREVRLVVGSTWMHAPSVEKVPVATIGYYLSRDTTMVSALAGCCLGQSHRILQCHSAL